MREILTIIAACIVVALAAALAVPPFVDWTKHGAAIAQKLGDYLPEAAVGWIGEPFSEQDLAPIVAELAAERGPTTR